MRYGIQRILPRYSEGVRKWDYGRAIKERAVMIHIMDGYLYGTDDWFRRWESGITSTHFGIGSASFFDRLVGKDDTIYQWVDTVNTAWGAHNNRPLAPYPYSVFGDLVGRLDFNHAIIHIEIEGTATSRWSAKKIAALNRLLAAIGDAHGPLWITKHNDIQYKVCPGTAVPWSQIVPTYGKTLGSIPKPEEDDMYAWVERMEYQTPKKMKIPAGVPVFREPGENAYARSEGQTVVLVGELRNEGLWAFLSRPTGLGLVRKSQAGRISEL